jgi:hypothetical protein
MDTIERFSRITTTAASSLKLRMLGIVPTTTPPHTEDVASNSPPPQKRLSRKSNEVTVMQCFLGSVVIE